MSIDYRVVPAGTDDVYAAGADANHHATEAEAEETIASLRALGGEWDIDWDIIEEEAGEAAFRAWKAAGK